MSENKNKTLDASWTPIRIIEKPQKPNLMLVRSGKKSLHKEWIQDIDKEACNWDLMLSHFAETDPIPDDRADIIVRQNAFKFSAFHRLYKDIEWLQNYRFICLCDDDMMTCWSNINALFSTMEIYQLDLAQPALTRNSYSTHPICLQEENSLLRFTNFAEVMAPIFSASALKMCLPSFEGSITGWGLDWAWPQILGQPKTKIAIIDACPMRHTRPAGWGQLYPAAKSYGINDAMDEANANIMKYDVSEPNMARVFGRIYPEPILMETKTEEAKAIAEERLPFIIAPERAERCDNIISTLALSPKQSAWMDIHGMVKIQNWEADGAEEYDIPTLSAEDEVMSFGFLAELESIIGGDVTLARLGLSEYGTRLIISTRDIDKKHFSLNLEIFASDLPPANITLPDLAFGSPLNFAIQLMPREGYVRIKRNEILMDGVFLMPWQWFPIEKILLGSENLKGSISSIWISPMGALSLAAIA